MPKLRLRRVRPAADRLDLHPLHQRGDMEPANLSTFQPKETAQHSAAGDRVSQMGDIAECLSGVRAKGDWLIPWFAAA